MYPLFAISIAFLLVWGALNAGGKTNIEIQAMYGQIIAFTLWIYQLYRPIRQLADKFNVLQRGIVRAERIFEIMDRNDHRQDSGKHEGVDFRKDISFDKVSFSYTENNDVLKQINLKIETGKMIAIVGATGSGKSTIANIILLQPNNNPQEVLSADDFFVDYSGDYIFDGNKIKEAHNYCQFRCSERAAYLRVFIKKGINWS